jgi:hypothetical protein
VLPLSGKRKILDLTREKSYDEVAKNFRKTGFSVHEIVKKEKINSW